MPKITELAHKRGTDGQLLPVEKEIDVRGEDEPVTVEVYPATTGQRREWKQQLQEADEELSEELTAELYDEFLNYDPEDFNGAKSWSDIRPALDDALGNAVLAEIFDTEEDDFSEALNNAMAEVTGGQGNLDLEETED